MNLERLDIYRIITATSAKAISALGVISLQLLIARINGESAVGQFSSMLSVLFFIGIVSRWGGAELIFKDARMIEKERGTENRNTFIFHIMLHTLGRAVFVTFVAVVINFFILPIFGFNTLEAQEYYFLLFVAPLFALASVNANYFYLINKNFIAGFSEPGGIAFVSSLLIFIGMLIGVVDSESSLILLVYALVVVIFAAWPIITLAYTSGLKKTNDISQSVRNTQFLQTSLFVYFGQWGVIAALSATKPSAIIGIFAVCLQVSVFLDFFMRIAGSLYSHRIRLSYETMSIENFASQVEKITRAIAAASGIAFVVLLVCAELVFDAFGFTDDRFYYMFFVLITARFVNNLFGLTDAFLMMTNFQREYKWIIVISSSIAFAAACLGSVLPIEVVASMVALTIVLRNVLASIIIYRRSGLIMLPLFVRAVR